MNFLKRIFKSKDNGPNQDKKKQKTSFLTWLCATKPHAQYQGTYGTGMRLVTPDSSAKISVAQTNNTKIVKRLSFGQDRSDYAQQELKSLLITIEQKRLSRIEDLIEENGIYAMINSDQPLLEQQETSFWLKIGKNQELNSLLHIKPYYFDRIFMIFDEFGGQYSIQQILKCKQNVCLKIANKASKQWFVDCYEKQLIKHFAFRLMVDCFNKLKITVIRTKRNETWLMFNQESSPDVFVNDILRQIGFDQRHEEYEVLKQQIPKGLTLQEYIDIMEHKQKLQSKYEGQSVGEYIKNKFLQKISGKAITPRNDSPRTVEKENKKDNEQEYEQYILSMTANTLPKNLYDEKNASDRAGKIEKNQKSSYDQEIFEFNVYKDEKQQQVKRVAINRQRKKRSKSQDMCVSDLHSALQYDENDYFDQKQ